MSTRVGPPSSKYLHKNKSKISQYNIVLALPAATVPAPFATTSLSVWGPRSAHATRPAWCFSLRPLPCKSNSPPSVSASVYYNIYTQAAKRAASLATTLHLQRSVDRVVQPGADGTTMLPAICSRQSKCQKYPYSADRSESLYYATYKRSTCVYRYAQRLWAKLSIINNSNADMRRSYEAFARANLQRKKETSTVTLSHLLRRHKATKTLLRAHSAHHEPSRPDLPPRTLNTLHM